MIRRALPTVLPSLLTLALALGLLACGPEGSGSDAVAPAAGGEGGAAGSGLRMTTLVEGTGESPGPEDVVQVHYHGTFEDGKVFDSSVERGRPASFPLNGVIPCWTEALQRMKVNGKARIVCPPEIAYGKRGAPPIIPPDATLIFEVELLGIR